MTVDQLIRELQRWPAHTVVRAHNGLIEGDDEGGYFRYTPDETSAQEVTEVKYRGCDVVLVADGMCHGGA